jgi:hypothetical protein
MAVPFADTHKSKQISIFLADDHQVVRQSYTVWNPPIGRANAAAIFMFL